MNVASALNGAAMLAGMLLAHTAAQAANAPLSAETAGLCSAAVERAEAEHRMPPKILAALSLAETGRWYAAGQVSLAWPWTVTSGNYTHYLADKASAVAEVKKLQARGRRNIDVGCMQINLRYHPDAFAGLEEAFDPDTNVASAAQLFMDLHDRTRSWTLAIDRYHTSDPVRGLAYRRKVQKLWTIVRLRAAAEHRAAVTAAFLARRAAREAKRLAQN